MMGFDGDQTLLMFLQLIFELVMASNNTVYVHLIISIFGNGDILDEVGTDHIHFALGPPKYS